MLFLSIRYLFSKPKQSILTLTGIVLGTAAYVAISGMMLGFQTFIIDQLVNNDAHIKITARDEKVEIADVKAELFSENTLAHWISPPSGRRGELNIENVQGWMDRLREDPRVEAYSPQIRTQVIMGSGKQSISASLVGIEPEKQMLVSTIDKYMVEGKLRDIGNSGNRIVIGQTLLENLGAKVGDTVLVSNAKLGPTPFRVVGKFFLGVHSLDESLAYGSLTDVQKINQTPSIISNLAVRLKDVSLARETAEGWSVMSPDKIQSWDQANDGILSVFKTQDIVRNTMTISILIVAGFGIFNILNMTVTQKRREIAILRSVGYEPKDIVSLFLSQGIILGLAGGLLGIIVGYFLCRYMATIQVSSARAIGNGTMMISFVPGIYIRGFFLALGSATLASFFPARSAGKLRPMEIIRAE